MGQYYKVIILADNKKNNKEVIILYIHPSQYNCGGKLMEQAYFNTSLLNTVEYILSKRGNFYKSRIVWAGDYADEEDEGDEGDEEGPMNLYHLADNYSDYQNMVSCNMSNYKYIVNHTKKQYVYKYESKKDNEGNEYNDGYKIHPLPLLVSEGNGKGGGDYSGNNQELCGTWARNVISMEETIPEGYEKLECNFSEY
jgi:hypothetical protein